MRWSISGWVFSFFFSKSLFVSDKIPRIPNIRKFQYKLLFILGFSKRDIASFWRPKKILWNSYLFSTTTSLLLCLNWSQWNGIDVCSKMCYELAYLKFEMCLLHFWTIIIIHFHFSVSHLKFCLAFFLPGCFFVFSFMVL